MKINKHVFRQSRVRQPTSSEIFRRLQPLRDNASDSWIRPMGLKLMSSWLSHSLWDLINLMSLWTFCYKPTFIDIYNIRSYHVLVNYAVNLYVKISKNPNRCPQSNGVHNVNFTIVLLFGKRIANNIHSLLLFSCKDSVNRLTGFLVASRRCECDNIFF